ncbi:hypothetical protein MRX96_045660 [Rhipicephalus microplus]
MVNRNDGSAICFKGERGVESECSGTRKEKRSRNKGDALERQGKWAWGEDLGDRLGRGGTLEGAELT